MCAEKLCKVSLPPFFKGSFEDWLHGGHYFLVKVGAMMPLPTDEVYLGIGPHPCKGERWDNSLCNVIWVEPCVYEADLVALLRAERMWNERVERAIEIAKEVHGDQKRDDGSPYLQQHVYPVTVTVLRIRRLLRSQVKEYRELFPDNDIWRINRCISKNTREKMVLAALLHDVLEDSDLDEDVLLREFGDEVYYMVRMLTKKRPGENYDEGEYYQRLMNAPRETRMVKLADRMNNLFCLQYTSKEKRQRYIKETIEHYLPLAAKTSAYFHLWMYKTLKQMEAEGV